MEHPLNAQVLSVDELLSLGTYQPAVVQRALVWRPAQVLRLLEDITAAAGLTGADEEPDAAGGPVAARPPTLDAYVIGTLQLRPRDGSRYDVYDGLQRMTTLTLILAILRDLLEGPERAACHRLVMTGQGPRLSLVSGNQTLHSYVQQPGSTRGRPPGGGYGQVSRRVLELRRALLDALDGWPASSLEALSRFVRQRVLVVALTVESEALGRQVFVATNAHGTPLSPVDLLKEAITAQAGDDADRIDARWEQLREVARPFDEFLQCVDMIERTAVQRASWPADLADWARERLTEPHHLRDWLDKLKEWAGAWRELQTTLGRGGRDELEHDVWRLGFFGWPEWKPLALLYLQRLREAREHDQAADVEQIRGFFSRFHQRCMAFTLAGGDRGQAFANAMAFALPSLRQDPTASRGPLRLRSRQLDKLRRTLQGEIREDSEWVPLLKWLEAHDWTDDLPRRLRRASVDHLTPRHPPAALTEAEGFDDAEYDRICYSLGNLAMIPRIVNEELGNVPWEDKRERLARYADQFWTLADALTHETMGIADVLARRDRLYRVIVERLDLHRRDRMGLTVA